MKISLTKKEFSQISTDALILITNGKDSYFALDEPFILKIVNDFKKDVKRKKIKKELIVSLPPKYKIKYLILYAVDFIKDFPLLEIIKTIASSIYSLCEGMNLSKVAFLVNKDVDGICPAISEGLMLGSYSFQKYKKEKDLFKDKLKVEIIAPSKDFSKEKRVVENTLIITEVINECRDLINEPGSIHTPEYLAKKAKNVGVENHLKVTVLNEKDLKKKGYNGLLAVGKGSANPPRLIVIEYKPKKLSKHHICLVGKGLTFDSGGICLKPQQDMWRMKGDMSGGAAVIYTMAIIGKRKPAVRVTGIIPATENTIDANAQKPGDIIKAKNGKFIHVINTDAEGRLILTDGFAKASEVKATHIIDVATLTGAVIGALGNNITGIFGNDKELVNYIIKCGEKTGENYWELPLFAEYKELLKSNVADIDNIGSSPYAGAITAALFLQEFIPEKTKWAHLDIAGTFMRSKPYKYYREGAVGVSIKTLIEAIMNFPKDIVIKK